MKRLVDLAPDDGLTARAHALVRAMGPTLESEERLQRVRRALDAPRTRWLGRGGLRAATIFALLGVSAVAAAGVITSVLRPVASETAPTPPVAAPVGGLQKRGLPVAGSDELPRPAPVTSAPALPRPASARASAALAPSDVTRVHEAAKALRRDADPERALDLLERSGQRVTGPLAEEAMALRIEALMARGDGRAVTLAAVYLAEYPKGRYRELAERALQTKKAVGRGK